MRSGFTDALRRDALSRINICRINEGQGLFSMTAMSPDLEHMTAEHHSIPLPSLKGDPLPNSESMGCPQEIQDATTLPVTFL